MNRYVFSILFFITLFLGGSREALAQREFYQEEGEKVPLSERLYFGGNFGLQFGRVTYVDVSPLVGVMITDRYSAGLGVTYQYLNYKDFANASSSVFGGRVFNRYNVVQNLFAHAEFESLNVELIRETSTGFEEYREWVPGLFLGGGYFVPFGRKGGINLTILYNVIYDNLKSPYNEPYVIRAGFVL
ncbi:hypothetical protein GCM10028791_13950 [Echinicola sediminis]